MPDEIGAAPEGVDSYARDNLWQALHGTLLNTLKCT